MGDPVPKVGSDRLIDFSSALIPTLHQALNLFQLFRQGKPRIGFDPRRDQQAADTLLRKILHAAPIVAGPFIGWSLPIIIDRDESQFIDPRSDVAIGIHVAPGGAGAERNTE